MQTESKANRWETLASLLWHKKSMKNNGFRDRPRTVLVGSRRLTIQGPAEHCLGTWRSHMRLPIADSLPTAVPKSFSLSASTLGRSPVWSLNPRALRNTIATHMLQDLSLCPIPAGSAIRNRKLYNTADCKPSASLPNASA